MEDLRRRMVLEFQEEVSVQKQHVIGATRNNPKTETRTVLEQLHRRHGSVAASWRFPELVHVVVDHHLGEPLSDA